MGPLVALLRAQHDVVAMPQQASSQYSSHNPLTQDSDFHWPLPSFPVRCAEADVGCWIPKRQIIGRPSLPSLGLVKQNPAKYVVYSFCMPQTVDADILAAALIGYQEKVKEIDARMADLRRRLGGKSAAPAAPAAAATAKRAVSAKARKRMAAAQRRRWAAVRRAKAAAAVKPAASRPAAKEAKPAAAPKRVVKKGAARKAKPAVAPKSAAQPKRQPARVKRAAVKRSAAESARTPKAAPAPQPEAGAPPVVAE